EIIFDAIKGQDKYDSTSHYNVRHCNDFHDNVGHCSLKIGVPKGIFDQGGIDEEVRNNFNDTISKLKSLGHTIVDIELPNISHALGVYYVIMPAEVSSNMARFDGIKYGNLKKGNNLLEDYLNTRGEGFGREVRRRIMLGTYVLSSGYYDAYYNKANKVRNVIRADFTKAFKEVDVILTPTAPTPAFKIGEKTKDPLSMYLEDIFTVTANLVGIPAISVPSGFSSEKLPLGIQIMAPHFKESTLFALGKDIEKLK
ncbi:MAG: amidase family protein, partial [Candidatus Paceibacterota bacterium]